MQHKKWILRFGTTIFALAIVTGCATTDNDNDPAQDGPLNQQEDNQDMMDQGGNNGGGGGGNGGGNGGNGGGGGGNGGGNSGTGN